MEVWYNKLNRRLQVSSAFLECSYWEGFKMLIHHRCKPSCIYVVLLNHCKVHHFQRKSFSRQTYSKSADLSLVHTKVMTCYAIQMQKVLYTGPTRALLTFLTSRGMNVISDLYIAGILDILLACCIGAQRPAPAVPFSPSDRQMNDGRGAG